MRSNGTLPSAPLANRPPATNARKKRAVAAPSTRTPPRPGVAAPRGLESRVLLGSHLVGLVRSNAEWWSLEGCVHWLV
eukprot:3918363-Prymnesium_polylepis.1